MTTTYEEAYIKVCEGYKNGKPIESLIKEYLYTLDPEEEYPSLNFDMWLRWACRESHDDNSNPVLILCMAEYIKEQLGWTTNMNDTSLNEATTAALTIIDVINWFSLDGDNPPTNIIGSTARYLFNTETVNKIISEATLPIDISMVSQLPDCGVEYFPRHEVMRHLAILERDYLEKHYINPDRPFK